MKTPQELVKNNLFYIRYGFNKLLFRVTYVTNTHVFAHTLKWCKKDSIPFCFKEFEERGYTYYKKMSKIRALFLM